MKKYKKYKLVRGLCILFLFLSIITAFLQPSLPFILSTLLAVIFFFKTLCIRYE